MLHKIKMLKTQRGSDNNNFKDYLFIEGKEYEIGEELLKPFIEMGVVELVKPKPAKIDNKAVLNVKEIKAVNKKGKKGNK